MTLYTTKTCPMCKILRAKLDEAGQEYSEVDDAEALQQLGISRVPVLEVGGEYLDMRKAVEYVNLRKEAKEYED